jgi:hypothetical protein
VRDHVRMGVGRQAPLEDDIAVIDDDGHLAHGIAVWHTHTITHM